MTPKKAEPNEQDNEGCNHTEAVLCYSCLRLAALRAMERGGDYTIAVSYEEYLRRFPPSK